MNLTNTIQEIPPTDTNIKIALILELNRSYFWRPTAQQLVDEIDEALKADINLSPETTQLLNQLKTNLKMERPPRYRCFF